MIPFSAPLDDILFSLDHVAGAAVDCGYDRDLHAEIARHFAAFAEAELAPLNAAGDAQGARLDGGRVRMPDGFREAYRRYCDQGWPGLVVPEDRGGQGLGAFALAITSEILAGANHAFEMTVGLASGAVRTLVAFGTSAQQARHIPPLATGAALATMALTEPGAGSDLSRILCRARRDGAAWRIDGTKQFISGGDQDLSEDILHLVLARTSDDGVRGLSLFLCHSTRGDGSRNAVSVTGIERKLGIHASATCAMHFDGAEAELLGAEGQGLAAMFTMMNHARLTVALQGAGHASRACAIARAYAADRVQGRIDGTAAVLARHPDVARMLDEIDLRAMGARGVAHLALGMLEREGDSDLVELLTPVAKVFATEVAFEAADAGIQVLGGYGFVEDYGMAQILRDVRICRIYEGANGIHALALATRMMRLGTPLEALDRLAADAGLMEAHASWRAAWAEMRALSDPRPLADAFMGLTAELVHQIVWTRIAAGAAAHPEPARIIRLARRARQRMGPARARFEAERALLASA